MRFKPLALLVLLVLVAACVDNSRSGLTQMNTGGVSTSSVSSSSIPIIGDILSCPGKTDIVLWALGAAFYLSMFVNFLRGAKNISSGGDFAHDIGGMAISVISFYIVKEMRLYCNFLYLVLAFVFINAAINKILSSGANMSFSGFGESIWKGITGGIKIRKGPKGENTEAEVKKEVESKLKEVQSYIKEADAKAQSRINKEHGDAQKAARQEIGGMGLKRRTKYAKIEEKLFEDADALTLLSEDLREDQKAAATDVGQIRDFEVTIQKEVRDTITLVAAFIKTHNEEMSAQLTKKANMEGHWLDEEMEKLKEITARLDASIKTTLNGITYFARFSALLDVSSRLADTADSYLKSTSKYENLKIKFEKKETNKKTKGLDKSAGDLSK